MVRAVKEKVEVPLDAKEWPLVEKDPIPTVYIDGFHGVTCFNGMIRINLVEDRLDYDSGKMSRNVVTRLVLPVQIFDSFVSTLQGIRNEIIKTPQQEQSQPDAE